MRTQLRLPAILLAISLCTQAPADVPAGTDARDAALLARMTLDEKVNQLMLLSKGTMTGPDSAGRPSYSAEELARNGIGFPSHHSTAKTSSRRRMKTIPPYRSRTPAV